jgi:uncharacterized protein YecA (UPF0149 family)
MDTRDGTIVSEAYVEALSKMEKRFFKPMVVGPTERQMARRPPKVGRNEPCPCGSGKKFKKCCLNSIR